MFNLMGFNGASIFGAGPSTRRRPYDEDLGFQTVTPDPQQQDEQDDDSQRVTPSNSSQFSDDYLKRFEKPMAPGYRLATDEDFAGASAETGGETGRILRELRRPKTSEENRLKYSTPNVGSAVAMAEEKARTGDSIANLRGDRGLNEPTESPTALGKLKELRTQVMAGNQQAYETMLRARKDPIFREALQDEVGELMRQQAEQRMYREMQFKSDEAAEERAFRAGEAEKDRTFRGTGAEADRDIKREESQAYRDYRQQMFDVDQAYKARQISLQEKEAEERAAHNEYLEKKQDEQLQIERDKLTTQEKIAGLRKDPEAQRAKAEEARKSLVYKAVMDRYEKEGWSPQRLNTELSDIENGRSGLNAAPEDPRRPIAGGALPPELSRALMEARDPRAVADVLGQVSMMMKPEQIREFTRLYQLKFGVSPAQTAEQYDQGFKNRSASQVMAEAMPFWATQMWGPKIANIFTRQMSGDQFQRRSAALKGIGQ